MVFGVRAIWVQEIWVLRHTSLFVSCMLRASVGGKYFRRAQRVMAFLRINLLLRSQAIRF